MMPTPVRILLAEDDRLLRTAAATALRRHGFEILTATHGEEALALVQAKTPDLILLDLIMPKLDGFEVLRRLKADPERRMIPVIVLSNLGQDSDVQRALDTGAAGYFVKSNLSLQDLVERVKETLAEPAMPSVRRDALENAG